MIPALSARVKLLKFILALLLLPAVIALSITGWRVAGELIAGVVAAVPAASAGSVRDGRLYTGIAFVAGYALWLIIFAVLPKPTRTYVLGHELTHALWAWCMGARVGGLRVSKTGGQVRTSKTNWAIVLAPYFFPFYAMLFLALFFIAHWIWNLEHYLPVLFFLVGLGWSFHVTFTLMLLFSTSQPDLRSQGVIFSFVIIYAMNLLTMLLTATLLSHRVDFIWLAQTAGNDLWTVYAWMLDKYILLWHRLAA